VALRWTRAAYGDLVRVHGFLEAVNPQAARRAARMLVAAVKRLPRNPHIGRTLESFEPRQVRRVVIGEYEVRYEVTRTDIVVLRIFHAREDR
jgi:plasmid stabilization system protein ParE